MISCKIFIFTRTVGDACPYKMLQILRADRALNKNLSYKLIKLSLINEKTAIHATAVFL